MDEKEGSEKSINLKPQIQCNHNMDKELKPMVATLHEVQCESSEKLIIRPSVTRNNDELKVSNTSVVEKTDKTNNIDPQQGWGKAVSFITNTSNKLSLCSALRSLMQILGVTIKGKTKENCSIQRNDLDNINSISDSSFTFFL